MCILQFQFQVYLEFLKNDNLPCKAFKLSQPHAIGPVVGASMIVVIAGGCAR